MPTMKTRAINRAVLKLEKIFNIEAGRNCQPYLNGAHELLQKQANRTVLPVPMAIRSAPTMY